MKIRTLLPVAAAALAIGVLGLPSAALAADGDPAQLVGLIERHPDGSALQYPIRAGETVPVVAGVTVQGEKGVDGIVVNLRIVDDLTLPQEFTNCQYYVDSNLHGAWCEIDGPAAPGVKYALTPLHVSAAAKATEAPSALIVAFMSKDDADSKGGVEALAKADAGRGTTTEAGTGGKLSLTEAPDLPLPKDPNAFAFVYLKLVAPSASPSPSPSVTTGTATPTATATTPAAPGSGGSGGGGGGGLPNTGSKSAAVAGLGAVLLVGGGAAFFLGRRRRAKFVA